LYPRVRVEGSGNRAVSQAGVVLLVETGRKKGLSAREWLMIPTQLLRELTGGAVFHDGLDLLKSYRSTLTWYPDDVWRYALAYQWMRLSQEEPFVGRCGEAGDDLGSAVVAARQVRDLMKLCLLMRRVYPPYSKWLCTAFTTLLCAPTLRSASSTCRRLTSSPPPCTMTSG
jgi:hypothetical protein